MNNVAELLCRTVFSRTFLFTSLQSITSCWESWETEHLLAGLLVVAIKMVTTIILHSKIYNVEDCWQVLNSSGILGNKIISFYRHHSVLFYFFFLLCTHLQRHKNAPVKPQCSFLNNIDRRFIQPFNDEELANVTRIIIIIIIFSKFTIFLHTLKRYCTVVIYRVCMCVCIFFFTCLFKATSSTEQKPSNKNFSFSSYAVCL